MKLRRKEIRIDSHARDVPASRHSVEGWFKLLDDRKGMYYYEPIVALVCIYMIICMHV